MSKFAAITQSAAAAAFLAITALTPISATAQSTRHGNPMRTEAWVIQVERERVVQSLIESLIEPTTSTEERCYATYALGVLRAEEAVPHLTKLINLRGDGLLSGLPPFGKYPSVEALSRIGLPSVPELIDVLQDTDELLPRELALRVMRTVFSETLRDNSKYDNGRVFGRFVIEQQLLRQSDEKKRARLQRALDELR
ncbi:MAG: hypothetical protein ACREJC_08885 [Tepidisphaeraceae bacterium]